MSSQQQQRSFALLRALQYIEVLRRGGGGHWDRRSVLSIQFYGFGFCPFHSNPSSRLVRPGQASASSPQSAVLDINDCPGPAQATRHNFFVSVESIRYPIMHVRPHARALARTQSNPYTPMDPFSSLIPHPSLGLPRAPPKRRRRRGSGRWGAVLDACAAASFCRAGRGRRLRAASDLCFARTFQAVAVTAEDRTE